MRKILFLLGCVLLSTQAAKALDMVYPVGKYNKTVTSIPKLQQAGDRQFDTGLVSYSPDEILAKWL